MIFLLHETASKSIEVLSNYLVTSILIVFASGLLLWKYRNYTKLYDQFPTYSATTIVIYNYLLNIFHRDIPFSSIIFQDVISILKKFQDNGLCLMWIFRPILIVFDGEAVKILSNEQDLIDKSSFYKTMEDVFGLSLMTRNGEKWRKYRKLLNPVFHIRTLKDIMPIFNKQAEKLVIKLAEVKDTSSANVLDFLQTCTFSIFSESILGLEMDKAENVEIMDNYKKKVHKLSDLTLFRAITPWMRSKFMLNFMPSGRRCLKMYEEFESLNRKIALEMKDSITSVTSTGSEAVDQGATSKSLAHVLFEHHLKDPTFTLEDIRSEVTTLLSAGYDTSSYALLWCLFLLGLHPEIQDRVYDELDSKVEGQKITYEDLTNLEYLDSVIKETLRLYPAAPVYLRTVKKDTQCGKYKVPKGTDVAFIPYMLHRNPKVFPDPEKFDPDRFFRRNVENLAWNFTPFSEGIRYCIGKKFAMMEMKVILAHVIRNYRVTSLDKREDVKLWWSIVLSPAKPLRMKIIRREQ